MSTGRPVVVDDLCRIRWPLDLALSPDGGSLAFVASGPECADDRLGYELFEIGLDGDETPSRLSGRARRPAWSPDGSGLAFLDGTTGTWRLEVPGWDCGAAECTDVVDFCWSEGSASLTLVSGDGRIAMVRGTGETVTLDDVVGTGRTPRMARCTPEGLLAVVCADSDGSHQELVVAGPRQAGSVVLRWDGPIHRVAWSPDGRHLAVTGKPQGNVGWSNNELWLVDPLGVAEPRRLGIALDRSIGQMVRGDDERGIEPGRVEWDGERVLVAYADGGRGILVSVGLDDSAEPLSDGDRAVLDFASVPGRTVLSWSDPFTPGAISVVEGEIESVVVDLNRTWAEEVELFPTKALDVPTDGGGVEGWLTMPHPSDGDAPLVVQIHGGPHYPVGFRFSFDAQRLAGSGIAVLRLNPRGSQGYGSDHAIGILADWGGADYADLTSLVDAAVSSPGVDGARLAVIGESYGGYLALWSATRSDRFGAVVAENAVADLTAIGRGPNGASFWHPEMGGSPDEIPALYQERSPITHVDDITAPVLLIHGEDDDTVPIGQSHELRRRLEGLGKEVTFHLVPHEGHFMNVFGAPSRRMDRTSVLDRFLRSRLGVGEEAVNASNRRERTS